MLDDNNGHILLPMIMSTCTTLRHALLQWQKNKGVHPKASKSKLTADRSDCLNYFNYKDDRCKNTSCCATTGHKSFPLAGVADTHTCLMNTWNTLPESNQQWVYKNTRATVRCQMQQEENPMPAVVISLEAAPVANAVLLDYLMSEVALEEPKIGSTDPNILMDNNCTDDKLHFRMPGGSWDYTNEGDEIHMHNAIRTASWL